MIFLGKSGVILAKFAVQWAGPDPHGLAPTAPHMVALSFHGDNPSFLVCALRDSPKALREGSSDNDSIEHILDTKEHRTIIISDVDVMLEQSALAK